MIALTRRPDARKANAPLGAAVASRLGKGVTVRGALEIEGDIVVAGTVLGRVAALKVVIAPYGFVEGDIVAREVVIGGRLDGRVFAPIITVEATATIKGRLFHHTLEVARGARIDGRTPWRPVNFFETLDHLPEALP